MREDSAVGASVMWAMIRIAAPQRGEPPVQKSEPAARSETPYRTGVSVCAWLRRA
jgi:hypothetical protein